MASGGTAAVDGGADGALSRRACAVQVLSSEQEPFQCGEASPFPVEGGEAAAVAHKYRSIPLGAEHTLIVRCEVDAVMQYKGSDQLLSVKALNEFDPKCAPADASS